MNYIAVELSNPKAASAFADNFKKSVDEARLFPESGSPVINEFVSDKNIRIKIIGNYIMFYYPDISQKIIYVLRIVYGRRNIDEIVRQIDDLNGFN